MSGNVFLDGDSCESCVCSPESKTVSWLGASKGGKASKTFLNGIVSTPIGLRSTAGKAEETVGAFEWTYADAETVIAPDYAGTRPHHVDPVFSVLGNASVENSAVTDLDSAKTEPAFTGLIAIAKQSSTFFSLSGFGCELALWLVALWTRSVC